MDEKELNGEGVQSCGEIQGSFKVCFSKLYDNQEKFFCLEDVKEIKVFGKVK